MIRLALAYLGLAVIVILGIVGIPGISLFGEDEPQAKLAPAASQPVTETAPAVDAVTPVLAALARAAGATGEETAPAVAAPAPQAAAVRPGAVDLHSMTAAILTELNRDVGTAPAVIAPAPGADDELTQMSKAVLQGLRSGAAEPAPAQKPQSLAGLVTQALAEGQSDAYIDALVNEAVGRGVSAPDGLLTTEGKVDTAVLLASIVARAQDEEQGEGDAPLPDVVPVGDNPVMQYLATEDLLYTVEPGDSLGALALRFYGDAAYYTAILAANTDRIGTANRILTGQRLIIPAFNKL